MDCSSFHGLIQSKYAVNKNTFCQAKLWGMFSLNHIKQISNALLWCEVQNIPHLHHLHISPLCIENT